MTYTARKSTPQRFLGLIFVALFHVVVIYLLVSGLGKSIVEVVSGPIETKVIEELTQESEPPPPPPPEFTPPPAFVPPPELNIAAEVAPQQTTAITQVQSKVATPPPPPKADVVTAPRSDPKRPVTQPPYPPTSSRLGEEGVVILDLYVLPDGKVGDARVRTSSGFPRLDEAAVKEAKRRWKFIPGTRNGAPEAAWMQLKVRFQLGK